MHLFQYHCPGTSNKQDMGRGFKPFGLSPSHAYVLRVVLDQPGIVMKQITEILELAPSTVTRFVDSLINKKLLKRELDDEDRRGALIYPTTDAKKNLHKTRTDSQELYLNMNQMIEKKAFSDLVTDIKNSTQALNKKITQNQTQHYQHIQATIFVCTRNNIRHGNN